MSARDEKKKTTGGAGKTGGAKTAAAPAPEAARPAPAEPLAGGEDPSAETKGAKRHQMTQILGIDISNARCHAHMKGNLIPAETEASLVEKRANLKAAKDAAKIAGQPFEEVEEISALKAEVDEINEKVVRIGGDAPIAMATIADWVTKALIKFAMDQTIAADRRMVEVAALHGGALEELGVWTLVRNLPSIVNYNADAEEALRKERAAANKAAKEVREAAKKVNDEGAPADARGEKNDDADDDESHGVTTTFNTYVDNATKTVKNEEAYKQMRVSNRLREVISTAVAELVASLSKVAKVAVLDLMGVRTLTAAHLKSVVKILYVRELGVEDHPGLLEVLAYVDAKLEAYHRHLEAEKGRKWDQMDPAKKEELEAKKAAAEEERKKLRVAAAKAKAIEAATLAKQLAADASVV